MSQEWGVSKDVLCLIVKRYARSREALLLVNSCTDMRSAFPKWARHKIFIKTAFPDYEECETCEVLVKKSEIKRHRLTGSCQKAFNIDGYGSGFYCPTCRIERKISWKKRSKHGPGRCGPSKEVTKTCLGCRRERFISQLHLFGKFCNQQCFGVYNANRMPWPEYPPARHLTHYFGCGNFIMKNNQNMKVDWCAWCARRCKMRPIEVPVRLLGEIGTVFLQGYQKCPCNCPNVVYCDEKCMKQHWEKCHQHECLS